jgi:hypothetical protein
LSRNFVLRLYCKNSFALVFKEMDHCCVVCCIMAANLV